MARITSFQESTLSVDEDGVIRGAKLLGFNSRNGRRYESNALKDAAKKYEGKKVYVDHPQPGTTGDRKFDDWAGVIENVRYEPRKGLFGDVVLRQESSHFRGIVEAANHPKFSKSCGFSHVAEGESHMDGDTEIVESIREVFSVDLVTDPATTAGFYESIGHEKQTLKEAVASLPESQSEIRQQLTEMMDAGYLDGGFGADNEKEPTSDPMSQIAAMLQTLVAALADVSKAAVKASKPDPVAPPAVGGAPGTPPADPAANSGEGTEEDEMSDEDKQKVEAFESLTRENAELKAKTLLIESGRSATDVRIKALASCPTDEDRRELLESWPKIEESTRPSRSPALVESLGDDFPRDNPEKFAALLR